MNAVAKREYKINSNKKEIRLTKTGYKGIERELSSTNLLGRRVIETILDGIYKKDKYYYDEDYSENNTMWNSYNCVIKSSAKCDDGDKFDEQTGMRICETKADLKYHNMMYNRYVYIDYVLGKLKLAISKLEKKHLEKIERLERDLDQYQK